MSFFDFFLFNEPSVITVALGALLIGLFSGFSGVFLVLDKKSLLGDAISHSLLPGICLAFIFHESKSPFVLLVGATFSGLLSSLFIDLITNKTKLGRDAAMAISLSFFFAIGIMLLTYIQHNYSSNQAGLESYIFGKAAAINREDLQVIAIFGVIVSGILLIFKKTLKLILFSDSFAQSIGIPVRAYRTLLSILSVLIIAIGIQAVGVILMAALLFAPAAIARLFTGNFNHVLIVSAVIGALSGLFGAAISYTIPGMPTGPWIVLILFALSLSSLLFKKIVAKNA